MQEIWYTDTNTGKRELLVPNLLLRWRLPSVGEAWGPFIVTLVNSQQGVVDIQAISNLLKGFAWSWKVYLRKTNVKARYLLIDHLYDGWGPPKVGECWGPFVVTEVTGDREAVIEPINELLTEMPGESRRRSPAY